MSKPRSRSSQQPHDRQRRRQQRRLVTETLESRAMMAVDTNPWHNDSFPGDVDQDRTFTPLDALLVVNDLNTFGSRSLLASTYPATSTPKASGGEPEATSFKVDVNNDNWVTPQDALRLINLLNGEGESPQVQMSVSALKLDGTALDIPPGASLPTVQVGTKFLIRAKVKDARTVPTGVDSAFLDVIYNQATVRVDLRENQMISVDRGQKAEGKFRLTLRNPVTNVQETTADITYAYGTKPIEDQTQFNIQKALEDLAIVDKGEVTVEAPPNTRPVELPDGKLADARFDFIVRFGGKYANTNVAEMTVTNVSMAKTPTVSQVSGTTAGNSLDFLRSITFDPLYSGFINANDGQAAGQTAVGSPAIPNMVDEVGGTNFDLSQDTTGELRVFDFEVTATGPGEAAFIADPSDTPTAKVILRGAIVVPSDQIQFTNVTVNVVQGVDAVNDTAPSAINEDNTAGVTIDVLANDVLNQGGSKRIIGTYPQTVTNGTVTLDTRNTTNLSDDRLKFTPSPNFFGTATFTYTMGDGLGNTDTATVTVTVNPVNDAPVNTVAGAQTINEDAPITFTGGTAFSVNDIDAGTQAISVTFSANNGTLALGVANPTGVTVTGNNTNNMHLTGSQVDIRAALAAGLTFIPTGNFPATGTTGTATIVMTTSDQGHTGLNDLPILTDTDTVTITVRALNDAPVNTVPGAQSIVEGTPLTLTGATKIQISDIDAGTGLVKTTIGLTPTNAGIVTVTSAAGGATLSGNGTTSVTITGTIAAINATLNNGVVYTPRTDLNNPLNNFIGSATLTVTTDDQGNTGFTNTPLSDTDTIAVDVRPAVRPFAVNDSFTVTEDSLVSASANQFNVLTNDIAHTGATLILKSFDTTNTQGTVTRAGDILQFAPNANFNGTTTFTYVINDTDESGADSTGTVTVTVSEVNDAPTGVGDDDKATNEGIALTFASSDLTSNDSKGPSNESGQTLTVSLPSGTTTLGGTVVLAGGQITYTPPANRNDLNGGPDKFVYQLTDNGTTAGVSTPLSATATVTISLTPVNDAPIASSDTATTAEDTALTIVGTTLTATDVPGPASATDEVGQTVTLIAVASTSANNGTVSLVAGSVVYTPAAHFNGSDTFTYTIRDNGKSGNPLVDDPKSATGTVTVTVTEVNDAPTAGPNEVVAIKNGGAVTYAPSVFLGNDSPGPANESGQTITITGVGTASHGTVILQNGSVVYTPTADFEGDDTFTYTIQDNGKTNGANEFKTATATVTVHVLNFVPVTISGYVYADLDNDGVRDTNETPLSGVDITLTGRDDVLGQVITPQTKMTDRNGFYEFVGLAPGEYFIQEGPPANMIDGKETVTSPLTVASNDRMRFAMTLQDNINNPQHVFANNNFGERGTLSAFMQLNYLLASSVTATSGQAEFLQGILFSFSDTDGEVLDWYSFRDGWAGYSLNSFTLAANRSSAVLRVTDSLNHTFQTTVTVDSARLRVRTDASGHSMAYVVGSYNDFTWQQVAQSTGQSGEGEAAEAADRAEMLAAVFGGSGNYAAAVDAALDDVVG